MALVDAITTAAAGVVAVGVRIALGADGWSFGAFAPVRTYATLLAGSWPSSCSSASPSASTPATA